MYMTQDTSDSSDKKPSRKSVRKKPSKPDSIEEESIEDEALKKKIQKALQTNLMDYAKKKNLSKKQISTINGFVEEHLSCFILLGYTVAGEPVTIINASTPRDSDALGTHIQKFLTKYVDPPPGYPPAH